MSDTLRVLHLPLFLLLLLAHAAQGEPDCGSERQLLQLVGPLEREIQDHALLYQVVTSSDNRMTTETKLLVMDGPRIYLEVHRDVLESTGTSKRSDVIHYYSGTHSWKYMSSGNQATRTASKDFEGASGEASYFSLFAGPTIHWVRGASWRFVLDAMSSAKPYARSDLSEIQSVGKGLTSYCTNRLKAFSGDLSSSTARLSAMGCVSKSTEEGKIVFRLSFLRREFIASPQCASTWEFEGGHLVRVTNTLDGITTEVYEMPVTGQSVTSSLPSHFGLKTYLPDGRCISSSHRIVGSAPYDGYLKSLPDLAVILPLGAKIQDIDNPADSFVLGEKRVLRPSEKDVPSLISRYFPDWKVR